MDSKNRTPVIQVHARARGRVRLKVSGLYRSGRLKQLLEEQLAGIEHTLQKFGDGTYGSCDNCGKLIDPARLEALPQANLCMDCKALQAKNAKGK